MEKAIMCVYFHNSNIKAIMYVYFYNSNIIKNKQVSVWEHLFNHLPVVFNITNFGNNWLLLTSFYWKKKMLQLDMLKCCSTREPRNKWTILNQFHLGQWLYPFMKIQKLLWYPVMSQKNVLKIILSLVSTMNCCHSQGIHWNTILPSLQVTSIGSKLLYH